MVRCCTAAKYSNRIDLQRLNVPPTAHDVRKQPPSTALPAVRDKEAVGLNPATRHH
jgi:hypothetical protein